MTVGRRSNEPARALEAGARPTSESWGSAWDALVGIGRMVADLTVGLEELGRRVETWAEQVTATMDQVFVDDSWSDDEGCWADVRADRDGDHPCNAPSDPSSTLGLCSEHLRRLAPRREE